MTAAAQARYKARRQATDLAGWRADEKERQERFREKHGDWQSYARATQARFRARHPEKKAAWNAVYQAVRSGRLIRPDSCEHCGVTCRPQASHDNYENRLAVEWLCRPCHTAKDFPQERGN